MKYKNAQDILPDHLLRELQQYVSGETLYVPNVREKKPWGESSGARAFLQKEERGNTLPIQSRKLSRKAGAEVQPLC